MPRIGHCLLAINGDLSSPRGNPNKLLDYARDVGFDGVISRWNSAYPDIEDQPKIGLASKLRQIVEVDLTRFSADHPVILLHPASFSVRYLGSAVAPIDPRSVAMRPTAVRARLDDISTVELLKPLIFNWLNAVIDAGVAGLRLTNSASIDRDFLLEFSKRARERCADFLIIGTGPSDHPFDALTVKFGNPARLVERYEALRLTTTVLAEVDHHSVLSGALADGVIVSEAMLLDHGASVNSVLSLVGATKPYRGEIRMISGTGADIAVFLRADSSDIRMAKRALLIFANQSSTAQSAPALTPFAGESELAQFASIEQPDGTPLLAGGVRIIRVERKTSSQSPVSPDSSSAHAAASAPRLVLENVTPSVAGGDFAVKRVVGEVVAVGATIYTDGHEQISAELLYAAQGQETWVAVPMSQLPNDAWNAALPLAQLGTYHFRIEAWLDRFGGFTRDYRKKLEAGVAQPVDAQEGLVLVEQAAMRSEQTIRSSLNDWIDRISRADGDGALLLSPELASLMQVADNRPHGLRSSIQRVDAERLQARYSSWYELFPRSTSGSPYRHGTFADVIERLPSIREMGFDTLYFPPIHPIGATNRKGPNNTLTPGPNDPGSPYAIGSEEGGHDAIHPELGTFDDFAKLVDAAHQHGLEVAIDFAIQCSPDHPWLREHVGWFAWRPDGSMKYAENPPKKYQDIVNVDFYADQSVPNLWLALRDVVLFWIAHGVKTFRVDNPHTKPLPFWEWMIGEVRSAHPDTIFLAEAFTRPAMMYRLAKVGFSQSYTYFTWRNNKQELINYITELTQTEPKDYYRPHFFVNTPDINPLYLQTSGRPGFRIRAVLAATLSGLFGVYSGFELCEAAPLPDREEYLDSEKYQLRQRDWRAPGNIVADITMLNRLRRGHPALQTHLNTRFYKAENDAIIYFANPERDGSGMILVMVNLDPHQGQDTNFEVPLWEFGLPDNSSVAVRDLAAGHLFRWQGKAQWIRLDPQEPYRIWRIAPGELA